jgi:hypothetical protein
MNNTAYKYFIAYRNKITNKFFGVVHLRTSKKKKGVILLSFITGPFTRAPKEYFTDPHSHYWVCAEIARLFLERGYDVDVIDAFNEHFIPKKNYTACIDLHHNLERLSLLLPQNCIKVMHIASSEPNFQNNAEQNRMKELLRRRNETTTMQRVDAVSNNPKYADFLEGYGNETVHGTYSAFGKKIIPIHVPVMKTYDFPINKDFKNTRKHFLWFGGGGSILKGLDLVVEVFSKTPDMRLTMIGPACYEKDFEKIYAKELNLPNITRYPRPKFTKNGEIQIGDKKLTEILDQCVAIVYPSASEGTSGSVLQAIHSGLIPIVSKETGINAEEAGGITLTSCSLSEIETAIKKVSEMSPEEIQKRAKMAWDYARKYHTKENFSKEYSSFIDTILKL